MPSDNSPTIQAKTLNLYTQPSHDSLLEAMQENIDELHRRLEAYRDRTPEIQAAIEAFEALGHISVDGGGSLDIRVTGDKDKFLTCWKLWRSLGYRLREIAPDATDFGEYITINNIRFWFYFSSTVCTRVQVGTRMEEVPIYETRCGEATSLSTPLSESDNEIPF